MLVPRMVARLEKTDEAERLQTITADFICAEASLFALRLPLAGQQWIEGKISTYLKSNLVLCLANQTPAAYLLYDKAGF